MSISTELSSDLAAALLTRESNEEKIDTQKRVAIMAEVHSTLRELTKEERRKGKRRLDSAPFTSPIPKTT